MKNYYSLALLALALLMIIACNSKKAKLKATQEELNRLQAEYAPLSAQYDKDCLYAPVEQVNAHRQLCEQENERMAPLGKKIVALQQQLIQMQQQ
jgi:hypothetical protein